METQYGRLAGMILAACFGAITLLHAYWGVGGTWGLQVSIGEGNQIPSKLVIWGVTIGLAVAAVGVLGYIGFWGEWVPGIVFRAGVWALFICLLAVTFLNASTGRPWEMFLIAPLCALLSVLAFITAKFPR
jgi:hypothetical protein